MICYVNKVLKDPFGESLILVVVRVSHIWVFLVVFMLIRIENVNAVTVEC